MLYLYLFPTKSQKERDTYEISLKNYFFILSRIIPKKIILSTAMTFY